MHYRKIDLHARATTIDASMLLHCAFYYANSCFRVNFHAIPQIAKCLHTHKNYKQDAHNITKILHKINLG